MSSQFKSLGNVKVIFCPGEADTLSPLGVNVGVGKVSADAAPNPRNSIKLKRAHVNFFINV